MNHLNDIDKLFKNAIEPLQEQPSEQVWQTVESILDQKNAENYKRKFILFKRISLALSILLILIGAYELTNRNKTEKNNITTLVQPNNIPLHQNKLSVEQKKKDYSTDKNILSANKGSADMLHNKIISIGSRKEIIPIKNNSTAISSTINSSEKNKWNAITEKEIALNNANFISHQELETIKLSNISLPIVHQPKSINQIIQPVTFQVNKSNSALIHRKKFQPQLSVTAFVAPQITQYNLKTNPAIIVPYQTQVYHQIEEEEKQQPSSFSAGLLLTYQFTKKWSVQTGINFSSTVIDINPSIIYASADANGAVKYRYNVSSGYVYVLPAFSSNPKIGDSLFVTSAKHTLQYINIPVTMGYTFQKQKIAITPSVGIGFNFLTSGLIETNFENSSQRESETLSNIEGLRKSYINMLLSVNVQYPITNKVSLSFTPLYNFAINSINKNNIVQSFPYSFAIAAGMMYKF